MTAEELLRQVRARGATFQVVEESRLKVRASSPLPIEIMEELRQHKTAILALLADQPAEIDDATAAVVGRLQEGQRWVVDQHNRWLSGDPSAATDEEFSRVWNGWWDLDQILRLDHKYVGCIYGQDGHCPDGFPCLGCCGLMSPGVVAQLALMDVDG